jgi:hypothetical protein
MMNIKEGITGNENVSVGKPKQKPPTASQPSSPAPFATHRDKKSAGVIRD